MNHSHLTFNRSRQRNLSTLRCIFDSIREKIFQYQIHHFDIRMNLLLRTRFNTQLNMLLLSCQYKLFQLHT